MNNKPSRAVFESWLATTGINLTDINPYALASWDAWQACETYSQSKINLVRDQRDQYAQRIGELEGLLREAHDTYRAAIHWEDLRGTMKRIDAALTGVTE